MMDPTPHDPDAMQLSLDVFLRDILPEIKLSLGELIDRENARTLPGRYARLLPETLLAVNLRPDAAETLTPIAAEIERELTDSCTRHGSLYDRVYRVQLRRSDDRDAPLFAISAHAGHDLAEPPPLEPDTPASSEPSVATAHAPAGPLPALPLADPDATRAEGAGGAFGWEAGRWMLVVENEQGEEQEVFRLTEPFTTVGRRSDDPMLRVTVGLSGVPHVSRRQLALLWDEEAGEPAFHVYNLGLNPLHVGGREVPGARVGRATVRYEEIEDAHVARVDPGESVRIGDRGPTLRVEEVPAPAEDPDATRYE
ncbi:hypothetical protein BH23GEM3_BH23GEM3_27080 [soil metagenome]|nr:hypothetical protein [Gemmatimonadota bacterium]